MKINARLKKIGDLVEANSLCLDVGCDHALLDIYLAKQNKNIKVVGSDIADGPLKQASINIKKEKLSQEIELRKGDGLETYTNDLNTIIISGMGGKNIIGILKKDIKKLKNVNTLILSPNNYIEDVKKYVSHIGFYIDKEELVKDKKFIYQIVIFKRGKKKYSKKEYFFGPILLVKKGPLFREYYEREIQTREILLTLLPKKYKYKKYKIKKEIKMIKKEIVDK